MQPEIAGYVILCKELPGKNEMFQLQTCSKEILKTGAKAELNSAK